MKLDLKCIFICLAAGLMMLLISFESTSAQSEDPSGPLLIQPLQIRAETDSVLSIDVSKDGKDIVYVTGGQTSATLWMGSADPEVLELPRKLADGLSGKRSPAISPKGRQIAYVDTRFDAKGDIFLINPEKPKNAPIRLTGRETADASPVFSPDGDRLYFHQAKGTGLNHLVALDLTKPDSSPQPIDTGGDAMYAAVSQDGEKLAFVSFRADPSGDIFVYHLETGHIRQITSGPAIDRFPAWGIKSEEIYFARIDADTNHDDEISTFDNSCICRIASENENALAYPLTPLNYSAIHPCIASNRLYYLTNRAQITNCWAIPITGSIPIMENSPAQLAVAFKIDQKIPAEPYLSLLAYYRVMEAFPDQEAIAAKAGFNVGALYEQLGLNHSAQKAYAHVSDRYSAVVPEGLIANIRKIKLDGLRLINQQSAQTQRREILRDTLASIDQVSKDTEISVQAEAVLAKTSLMISQNEAAADILTLLQWLDPIIKNEQIPAKNRAQALFLKAGTYQQAGLSETGMETYRQLIKHFPDQRPYSEKAVNWLLDADLADTLDDDAELRITKLRRTAEANREKIPVLSMAALNRIGDIYYANENWEAAKSSYQTVIDNYEQMNTQAAAARFSLAEILYREERFRQALDLYEKEIDRRPSTDRIYQLARNGYIRKTISAGEFLYRLGEIPSARNTFRELIDYDESIVEAHRGYIKCAAAGGDIQETLSEYQQKLEDHPNRPLWLYTTGLSLTYLETEAAIKDARQLIMKAIQLNGHVEYYHQTLGYTCEVLETVYNHPRQLEYALEAYKKAYFLNDPDTNPENAGNLELNLGNTYYLLRQYGKALEFYTDRLIRDTAFTDPNTEIIFYKRLGESAFQARDTEQAKTAYAQALEKIDKRMAPLSSAKNLDRLHRLVRDRIIAPALKLPDLEGRAREIATIQAGISQRVSDYAKNAEAPPSNAWNQYKSGILQLLDEQKNLNESAAALARDVNLACANGKCRAFIENPAETLRRMTENIRASLSFPDQLTELKTEMTDRFGLACQELENWETAIQAFKQVFSLNQKQGRTQNLARNRRAVAYNTYHYARTFSGQKRRRLLKTAAEEFQQVLELIDTYGVPKPEEQKKQALINISVQTALDAEGATEAARGFSEAQERRLAEAFISRIHLELGELDTARLFLEKQLAEYPINAEVAEKDRYGVALLYHRAGLLAHAMGDKEPALSRFEYSAGLCISMQAPVSAAMNVMNMAAIYQDYPSVSDLTASRIKKFQRLDRETQGLLEHSAGTQDSLQLAEYHNTVGVAYVLMADLVSGADAESTVRRMNCFRDAAGHFTDGITIFGRTELRPARRALEIEAKLNLNLAEVAHRLGEPEGAHSKLESALEVAETGLLPDLKWRALAGLGRLEEALDVLEELTLSRAGCRHMEIINAFGAMVSEAAENENAEAAFNLAEHISELERFNRTAEIHRPRDPQEIEFFEQIYPRLERIQKYQSELKSAGPDKKSFIKDRLDRELSLLDIETENLPDSIRRIADQDTRYRVMRLFGASVSSEKTAENLAAEKRRENPDKDKLGRLQFRYQELIDAYDKTLLEFENSPGPMPKDWPAFFSPRPAEVIDVIAALDSDEQMLRLFPAGAGHSEYIAFTISPDEISSRIIKRTEVSNHIALTSESASITYIAYEDPLALMLDAAYPQVLSGTHLFRCFSNRKPFKHYLLNLSEMVDLSTLSDMFDILPWKNVPTTSSPESEYALSVANTLVLPHRLAMVSNVPTNAGEKAKPFLALYTGGSNRIPLTEVLGQTSNLTLSILSDLDITEIDRIAYLFSLYGCPGLSIAQKPMPQEKNLIETLLTGYFEMTAFDASAEVNDQFQILYVGDSGMTPEEATDFAKSEFINSIKAGRAAFDNDSPQKALINFDNAISIATEIKEFSQYLPALYQFGRESAYQAGNLEKARIFAQNLADMLEASQPDSPAHAEAMLTLGLIHARLSQYDQAVRVIETAVEMFAMLEADQQLASAMKDLGVVLENATHYESALTRFQKAAELSREINDQQMLAAQQINIGRIYDLRLNRYPEAIRHYEKAMKLYTQLNDPEKIAESQLNIGRCYRLLGVFPKADAAYQEALSLASSEDTAISTPLKAKIIIEQANNAWFQGDFEAAFKLQRQCQELAGSNNYPLLQAMAQNTAGLIWWSLGNYEKALTELETALSQARELDIRPDEIASTLNNIGLVHREMGNYEKALATFDQALAIDTELQSKWAMAYDHRNKGLTYLEMNQPDTAVPLFDEAFRLSDAIGNQINAAKAQLGKGNALLALKDYTAAKQAYNQALSLSTDMRIKETHWRALYGLGQVSQASDNDQEAAETYLRGAIDIIESMRSAIKVKDLKENFMKNRLDVYEDLVKLLAGMGKPEAAFEIAERSRSRNFIDLLGTQRVSLGSQVEAELYDKQAMLSAEIEAAEQLLAAAETPTEVETYQRAVKQLKNQRQNLMIDIQAKHPRLSTLISIPPVSVAKITERLETGVVLVSYYVLDNEILCWVLKNPADSSPVANMRLIRIPSDQNLIENRILEYRRIIQNLEPYEKHSKALYDRLIAPVMSELSGVHTLGIIPHGPLHYLSFATLYSGDNFLIDDFSLFYLPSASVLDYTLARRIKRPKLQLQVLAIGNPDLDNPALELPFAEQEVNSIHWNFPEITTLTRDKATEAWVVKNIARFDIIHIASHGEFDPVNPLMSAIKLSRTDRENAETVTADGDLRAAEVFGLDIRADMVCLSACQTGLGKVKAGDEIIGLNRSFFYAGTHTIISSLWRVSDVSTAMLIKTFYRRYTQNNKADSLQAAARHVKNRYPHPGYWGAFTLVGDFK